MHIQFRIILKFIYKRMEHRGLYSQHLGNEGRRIPSFKIILDCTASSRQARFTQDPVSVREEVLQARLLEVQRRAQRPLVALANLLTRVQRTELLAAAWHRCQGTQGALRTSQRKPRN